MQENDCIGNLPVVVEAESGDACSGFALAQDGKITYITTITSHTNQTPAYTASIITYEVTFADSGYYNLFARVRVGAVTLQEKDSVSKMQLMAMIGFC